MSFGVGLGTSFATDFCIGLGLLFEPGVTRGNELGLLIVGSVTSLLELGLGGTIGLGLFDAGDCGAGDCAGDGDPPPLVLDSDDGDGDSVLDPSVVGDGVLDLSVVGDGVLDPSVVALRWQHALASETVHANP